MATSGRSWLDRMLSRQSRRSRAPIQPLPPPGHVFVQSARSTTKARPVANCRFWVRKRNWTPRRRRRRSAGGARARWKTTGGTALRRRRLRATSLRCARADVDAAAPRNTLPVPRTSQLTRRARGRCSRATTSGSAASTCGPTYKTTGAERRAGRGSSVFRWTTRASRVGFGYSSETKGMHVYESRSVCDGVGAASTFKRHNPPSHEIY